MDTLSDILTWEYCGSKVRPLTQAQQENFSYFRDYYVKFEVFTDEQSGAE